MERFFIAALNPKPFIVGTLRRVDSRVMPREMLEIACKGGFQMVYRVVQGFKSVKGFKG